MRFGVLSTANIGQKAVIPGIRGAGHEVVAIASRDDDRAEAVAADLDVDRAYDSYERLLDAASVDAVYVPLPNALHAEWTKRAADAGLHVLCEKPLAVDADEARELGDYCDDAGVTLMEAFMYRYHPRTERAVEVVDGQLDRVRGAFATFQFPLRGGPDDIRLDPDLAGGSLMDVGCYAVSALRTLLGEPDRVRARVLDTRGCGVDTHLTGTFEYDGATAQLSSSFDTPPAQRYRVEAENGWLEVDGAFNPGDADEPQSLSYAVDGRTVTETFDPVDQYAEQVRHFVECVRTGRRPRTDADEAVANMRVIDALYESAETGAAVPVEAPR
ncbi:Gfo/Idh/MocA family protein [Haloarchaeobius sp. HRN-SO-5]|uniref:Gfo/Idh/MocA family protein n=1 Tax=Haloarchaeobius sp. HRN-SO-5 TaxID=3446118 RepID=UPI003EBCBCA6